MLQVRYVKESSRIHLADDDDLILAIFRSEVQVGGKTCFVGGNRCLMGHVGASGK